jgi:hypothetical protein
MLFRISRTDLVAGSWFQKLSTADSKLTRSCSDSVVAVALTDGALVVAAQVPLTRTWRPGGTATPPDETERAMLTAAGDGRDGNGTGHELLGPARPSVGFGSRGGQRRNQKKMAQRHVRVASQPDSAL